MGTGRRRDRDWPGIAHPGMLRILFLVWSCGLVGRGAEGQLSLSLEQVIPLSHLTSTVGGAAHADSTGRLWIADAGSTNTVFELDSFTAEVRSFFDAGVVPGLNAGPDAMAIHPTSGNLFLFSVFTERKAGEVTQQGTLVRELAAGSDTAALAFHPSGRLYGLTQSTGSLVEIDPGTGIEISSARLTNFVGRVAAADFDPITGNLFGYADASDTLLEVDVATATVVSITDMSPFLTQSTFPTGIAFDRDGGRLFLARGSGGPDLIILGRCFQASRIGSVNAARGLPVDVLTLNGSAGEGEDRKVEYPVLSTFELAMRRPPAVSRDEEAPFAVYAWGVEPGPCSGRALPFGIGSTVLPMPLTGGEPQPDVIWNNARRFHLLGLPTHPSSPAPGVFFRRPNGLRRAARFIVQGLIFDPGSAAGVPASVTNAIQAIPVFQ